jgi:hypothetical protein
MDRNFYFTIRTRLDMRRGTGFVHTFGITEAASGAGSSTPAGD